MADTVDWKLKYRDSLLEMEVEEQRWRQVEQILRRLVGRLCAAGMGVHPELDAELSALAAANRRNAAVEELERLAASLTTAVVAVDAVAPVLTAAAYRTTAAPVSPAPSAPLEPVAQVWAMTRAAAETLLENLKSVDPDSTVIDECRAALPEVKDDDALAEILTRVANLIRERAEVVSRERTQASAVLAEVSQRLDEMSQFLTSSNDMSRSRFADTESLNNTVMTQVRELSEEVNGATDLTLLRSLVSDRLESMAEQVVSFRAREQTRMFEQIHSADNLRAQIADLERETSDLRAKLASEKHGARLDPLTRLANRKSFDERFAQEIVRRSSSDTPVAMLLWDLDNFKVINDTYGHRAGDRVLQNVASCFMAGLRTHDFVARIGGEEFVVLVSGVPMEGVMTVADELRKAVEALRFHFRGAPVRVTVSCGLTTLRQNDTAEAAFDRADAALYRAKRGGKNACIVG